MNNLIKKTSQTEVSFANQLSAIRHSFNEVLDKAKALQDSISAKLYEIDIKIMDLKDKSEEIKAVESTNNKFIEDLEKLL